jgi:hypothetical protein
MKKQTKKQIGIRIEKAYYASCKGVQIKIMDIPKVWKIGEQIVLTGGDDLMLQAGLRKFVDQIAVA